MFNLGKEEKKMNRKLLFLGYLMVINTLVIFGGFSSDLSEDDPIVLLRSSKERLLSQAPIEQKGAIDVSPDNVWQIRAYKFKNQKIQQYFREYYDQSFAGYKFISKIAETSQKQNNLSNSFFNDFRKNGNNESLINASYYNHAIALYELSLKVMFEDPTFASILIHRSAAQGYDEALYRLSNSYENAPYYFDLGEDTDDEMAKLLCEEARILNHKKAEYDLAVAPLQGAFGIKKDTTLGLENLSAIRAENKFAKNTLTVLQKSSKEEILEIFDENIEIPTFMGFESFERPSSGKNILTVSRGPSRTLIYFSSSLLESFLIIGSNLFFSETIDPLAARRYSAESLSLAPISRLYRHRPVTLYTFLKKEAEGKTKGKRKSQSSYVVTLSNVEGVENFE